MSDKPLYTWTSDGECSALRKYKLFPFGEGDGENGKRTESRFTWTIPLGEGTHHESKAEVDVTRCSHVVQVDALSIPGLDLKPLRIANGIPVGSHHPRERLPGGHNLRGKWDGSSKRRGAERESEDGLDGGREAGRERGAREGSEGWEALALG